MTNESEGPRWPIPRGLKIGYFMFLGREEMFDVWHDMRDGDLMVVTSPDTDLFANYDYIHARHGEPDIGDIAKMDPLSMCIAHQILEKYYDGSNARSKGQSQSHQAAEG